MLNAHPLVSLSAQLTASIAAMRLSSMRFGDPESLEHAARESAELFRGYAKAKLADTDPYACALAFLRGQIPNEEQLHLMAGVLAKPLKDMGGKRLLGLAKFSTLMSFYQRAADAEELSLLTWFGLLCSYFAFNPHAAPAHDLAGWEKLRATLLRTWPTMNRLAGIDGAPDWIKVLRDDPGLLSDRAADHYALAFLQGDMTDVRRLSTDLGIPESSWFWHLLVKSAASCAATQNDETFKSLIPKLLTFLDARPVFRDEGLAIVLTRYYQCAEAPLHRVLYDYVVRKDVWKNPELKSAQSAPAWHRVEEPVWRMVLGWVNEGNMRDFFGVLAARHEAEEGRSAFWHDYRGQISWTRFIFSPQTASIAKKHGAIRDMIGREEGAYAAFWGAKGVDALMMQIGEYLIVEFSTKGNATYVYDASKLSFDRYSLKYLGGTEELQYGFRGAAALRVARKPGWEAVAREGLGRLGIQPDQAD